MKKQNFYGQSLFEVLFAVGIIALVIVGVVSLSSRSIKNESFSRNQTLASRYAQEANEWLRQQRDSGWTNFYNRSSAGGTVWCLSGLSWPASSGDCGPFIVGTNIYTRRVTLTRGGADTVTAQIEVGWTDDSGTHSIRTAGDFTNWRR